MDQSQIRQAADRFIHQLHCLEDSQEAGVQDVAALFSDDAQLTNPIIGRHGKPCSGQDEIAGFWREYRSSFQEIHSDFTDITASDRSAGLFWRSVGKDAGGKPLEYEGVSLLEFDEGGKIRRFKAYFDSRATTLNPGMQK